MKTLFNPPMAAAIRERMARVRPDTHPRWGRMNAAQMVCHLTDSFRVALGEVPVAFKPNPLTFYPLRWLLVYVLPTPKGKIPTTPEFQLTKPADWQADLQAWNDACDRFIQRGGSADSEWGVHPAFGHLSAREWGRLTHLHFNHHLTQFGV
ncbi:MAG TPA: DUF1569 domain-containing protein [Thermoanaerobaculaceae bacterium]|nr:DUF1569 domain-containing protein [Thermoanaerobaculaceae bacterium]